MANALIRLGTTDGMIDRLGNADRFFAISDPLGEFSLLCKGLA